MRYPTREYQHDPSSLNTPRVAFSFRSDNTTQTTKSAQSANPRVLRSCLLTMKGHISVCKFPNFEVTQDRHTRPHTSTRCVPASAPASANSTVTSMCIGQPGVPQELDAMLELLDPTVRNGSKRHHAQPAEYRCPQQRPAQCHGRDPETGDLESETCTNNHRSSRRQPAVPHVTAPMWPAPPSAADASPAARPVQFCPVSTHVGPLFHGPTRRCSHSIAGRLIRRQKMYFGDPIGRSDDQVGPQPTWPDFHGGTYAKRHSTLGNKLRPYLAVVQRDYKFSGVKKS